MAYGNVESRATVLLVDDETRIRKALRIGLIREGYDVLEAANGQDALDLLFEFNPDIVVADIAMPVLTGTDLVRAMRANETTARTPFIAVSADASTDRRVAMLDEGADDFIAKPFALTELSARVRRTLEREVVTQPEYEIVSDAKHVLEEPRHLDLGRLAMAFGLALAVAAVSVATYWYGGWVGAATAVLLAVVAFLGHRLDPFGGIVVGMIGGLGVTILINFRTPGLTSFALLSLTVAMFVGIGALAGTLGEAHRRKLRRDASRESADGRVAATGSLGMLNAEAGALLLAEERHRAILHGRPLSLAMVSIMEKASLLDNDDFGRLRRAVARIIESELRGTDIPYCDDTASFWVIMPEAETDAATALMERIVEVAGSATFAAREIGQRRQVGEFATIGFVVTDGTEAKAEAKTTVVAG